MPSKDIPVTVAASLQKQTTSTRDLLFVLWLSALVDSAKLPTVVRHDFRTRAKQARCIPLDL